jgi:vacuole morphology and inheritance protein 14
MLDYLPEFLDGLFNMLSDSNKEIKQAADNAISEFLREIKEAELVEFGPMVNILVGQCRSKERSNRLTALKWLIEFIHLGGSRLVLFYAGVLGSVMYCISDQEPEISQTAKTANRLLMNLVKATAEPFDLLPLFHTLTVELLSEHVTTRVASLHWINMLIQCKGEAARQAIGDILPALLTKISDPADEVVLINLQVLARLSLVQAQFVQVLHALVELFLEDRSLLETRGALVIRKLCALLDSRSIYLSLSAILSSRPELEFVSHMVQTLNLILLTAPELSVLRKSLKECFQAPVNREMTTNSSSGRLIESDKGGSSNATASVASSKEQDRLTFVQLFRCWCHNPVATFSLCLLAQAYDLSARLVLKFSEVDVTVGFLMQVDKLVQLLESPIFVHLRLQLLDVASKRHADLLRTLYGLLMLLPQSQAYKTLSDRLAAVSSLHMHIGFSRANNLSALVHPSPATPSSSSSSSAAIGCDQQTITEEAAAIEAEALDAAELLERFDDIQWRHSSFRMSILRQTSLLDAAASFVPSSVERMDDIDGLDAPSSDTTNLGRPS